jgi:hypothetical protein
VLDWRELLEVGTRAQLVEDRFGVWVQTGIAIIGFAVCLFY